MRSAPQGDSSESAWTYDYKNRQLPKPLASEPGAFFMDDCLTTVFPECYVFDNPSMRLLKSDKVRVHVIDACNELS